MLNKKQSRNGTKLFFLFCLLLLIYASTAEAKDTLEDDPTIQQLEKSGVHLFSSEWLIYLQNFVPPHARLPGHPGNLSVADVSNPEKLKKVLGSYSLDVEGNEVPDFYKAFGDGRIDYPLHPELLKLLAYGLQRGDAKKQSKLLTHIAEILGAHAKDHVVPMETFTTVFQLKMRKSYWTAMRTAGW